MSRWKGDAPGSIVVTGVGLCTPIGNSFNSFAQNLLGGVSGIRRREAYDSEHPIPMVAGHVEGFRLDRHLGKADLARVEALRSRGASMGVAALLDAVKDAKLAGAYASERVAVCGGTGFIGFSLAEAGAHLLAMVHHEEGLPTLADLAEAVLRCQIPVDRHSPGASVRLAAGLAGFRGPVRIHQTTCAASAIAVLNGRDMLLRREVDACIAGGFDSQLGPVSSGMFEMLGVVNTADLPPEQRLRPFDRDRDGMVLGEGAVFLVLEREDDAVARGASRLARFLGGGASMDGHGITAPHPRGRGAAQSMRRALRNTGLGRESVDYINAHGTGTLLNDPVETFAVKSVFGADTKIPVSSSKPAFGHLIGASGAIESLATIVALVYQTLPATLNLEHADPECDLDHVPLRSRRARLDVAISNSFGFGGYNASLVFERTDA